MPKPEDIRLNPSPVKSDMQNYQDNQRKSVIAMQALGKSKMAEEHAKKQHYSGNNLHSHGTK